MAAKGSWKRRIRTGVIVLLVACIAIVTVQNADMVTTHVLFLRLEMPRFVLLILVGSIGFVLGVLLSRPRIERVEPLESGGDEPAS